MARAPSLIFAPPAGAERGLTLYFGGGRVRAPRHDLARLLGERGERGTARGGARAARRDQRLIDREPSVEAVPLELGPAVRRGAASSFALGLPSAPLAPSALVLEASDAYFDRGYRVSARCMAPRRRDRRMGLMRSLGLLRRGVLRLPGGLIGLAALVWAGAAAAQAAPDEWRSASYYAVNGALTAALIGGHALSGVLGSELEAGGDTVWFPGDAGLRGKCSPEAAQLSDVSLSLAVALPPAMELGGGLDARFVNAQVVYTQALMVNLLLTSATKVIFRRPRPFSYRKDADCALQVDEGDANRSFFSGHASGSFVAAFAGSFLMSERADLDTRAAIWGSELALAGATANLRARAGKHYYSDIIVGALVGAGVGLALPALHGADAPPRGSDLLAGAIGLVVGVAGSQLVAVGAETLEETSVSRMELLPARVAGGHGLLARGSW